MNDTLNKKSKELNCFENIEKVSRKCGSIPFVGDTNGAVLEIPKECLRPLSNSNSVAVAKSVGLASAIELDDIKSLLEEALFLFYSQDPELFEYQTEDKAVSERCIVFHIGWYLIDLLKKNKKLKYYSVDSEYNRCFNHSKSMYKQTESGIKEKIGDAYPDLIIHKRKSNDCNVAIFEFKKGGSYESYGRDSDYKKLEYFTDPKNEYKFRFGFWIVLLKIKKAIIHIFQGGKEYGHLCYTWNMEEYRHPIIARKS